LTDDYKQIQFTPIYIKGYDRLRPPTIEPNQSILHYFTFCYRSSSNVASSPLFESTSFRDILCGLTTPKITLGSHLPDGVALEGEIRVLLTNVRRPYSHANRLYHCREHRQWCNSLGIGVQISANIFFDAFAGEHIIRYELA
jgi:hypothetical protein